MCVAVTIRQTFFFCSVCFNCVLPHHIVFNFTLSALLAYTNFTQMGVESHAEFVSTHAGVYLNFGRSHVSVCLGKSLRPPTCPLLHCFVSNGSTTDTVHTGETPLGFLPGVFFLVSVQCVAFVNSSVLNCVYLEDKFKSQSLVPH